MSFYEQLSAQFPGLKKKLRMAHVEKTPVEYTREKFQGALFMSLGLTIFSFHNFS